ncbi:tannase/feruloyl esterase family alpha/beta hydrolase [Croceicoccus esteveae]|uniref:tannase/feruloyl esterase family alpha/beta hydrolase n=1 Tax=Croceicoccus esteveae TaxID=3075597 RepID=UPI003D77B655
MVAYYRIPGMAHCGGGTGPADAPDQLLQELIESVEDDRAPGPVVAHRGSDRARMAFANQSGTVAGVPVPPPTGAARDFLLCPYPMTATFTGDPSSDGVYDARNWECRGR